MSNTADITDPLVVWLMVQAYAASVAPAITAELLRVHKQTGGEMCDMAIKLPITNEAGALRVALEDLCHQAKLAQASR